MCGIAGYITFGSRDVSQMESVATRMADTMRHRGPDDSGIWVDAESGIALAHRRLAIQDLSSQGKQPMQSSSGRHWVSFNGEIYNFRALSRELRASGHRFQGHSDTEVLLAAIEAWGLEAAVRRFVGMFAFAIWDRKQQTLHLARDRMGEKPLYYGWLKREFVFASELKALCSHPEWISNIDRDALTLHMRYGYIPTPYSIYKGIFKLHPGSILSINSADLNSRESFSPHISSHNEMRIRPRPYWSLQSTARQNLRNQIDSDEDAIRELDRLLHQTVRDQMIADVPLGAFLSGGIDSSTVTAIMQAESRTPIKTFTIGFHEQDHNEAQHASKIADVLGTEHTELYLTPGDAMNVIPSLPTIYDEPFSDASQIPAYLVSKMARQHVTVCLSGDGGDELFAGYNRYLWTEKIFRKTRYAPTWLRTLAASMLTAISPGNWDRAFSLLSNLIKHDQPGAGIKIHKLAEILRQDNLVDIYRRLVSYWGNPESLVLNGRDIQSAITHDNLLGDDVDFIQQSLLWDLLSYLPDDNLTKVDRASMVVSLETRLPLLDHRIVEFSWRVPLTMKVRDMQSKWLLRQVLYKYVPKELIERPKMGFSVPIGVWLRGPLREWAEDLLNENRLSQEGFLNVGLIRKTWDEHLSGKRNCQLPLWSVLMFQAWHHSMPR